MNDCYAPYYNAGYRVYHVRGVYYTNYHASDGEPALLGKEILAEIPKDLAEYSDWKVVMLAFYGNELRRIRRIEKEREEMLREPVWGRHYVSKPTRVLIVSKPFTWAYIVDIDTDRLIVIGCDRSDGYFSVSVFRLNKIPRELFNHPNVFEGSGVLACAHPVIFTDVEAEYTPPLPPKRQVYAIGGLRQPRKHVDVSPTLPEGYSFSVSQPRRHSSAWCRRLSWNYSDDYESAVRKDNSTLWKSLRLLLLRQFLHRYNCTTRVYDGYGWQPKSFFVFRQLVYALVSIAHEANIIRFRERPASYEMGIGNPIDATPSWEPPTTDSYWIGDVLIVLDPDMNRRADHHAALIDAIQLSPGHKKTTAIVFSTSHVTAFEVNRLPDGVHISQISGKGSVFGNPQRACCICCCMDQPTPSLLLLIDILASASAKVNPPRSYPALPVEICETIYDCAPPATQRALRASCRLFNTFFQRINRDIQVGEWRLKTSPGRCPSRYSGTSGQGSSLEDVDLKTGHLKAESGYEVRMLTEKGAIELDLSLFGIVKATDEDCCRNYPETEDSLDAGCPPRCTAHYHQGYSGISGSQVGLCGDVMGLWGELSERSRKKVSGEWCEMGWREIS